MALVELRVRGLAVLDSVRLTPGPGFTALTGETGSGKSLCISALRLALGGRVEGDLVRAGREAASVAAVFDDIPVAVRSRLETHGIADDELLTLVRELPRGGRGACRVNGALVSLATLRELGEELVEVTAQGESHRLLRPQRQRALVDAAGGTELAVARTAMAEAHLRRREADAALEDLRARLAGDAAALQRAREMVAELEPLALRPGEDEELATERRRLRHSESLAAAAEGMRAGCIDDGGAADTVAAALATARGVEGVDAGIDALVEAGVDLLERIRDLGGRARHLAASLDLDPSRLGQVEERLDVLDRVRRRHGSVEGALDELAAARLLVDAAEGDGGVVRRHEEASAGAAAVAAEMALRLSALRARAASRLEREVTAQLRCLRLPHARFRIILGRQSDAGGLEIDGERLACGPDGVDLVEMRLATTRDGVPIPLDGGVSGGELSRVALALRAVVAAADDCPTLVLDEVDTGLGGDTAARVGEVLAAVGSRRQLVVVTHRAEIAARATTHLRVERHDLAGTASAEVDAVAGDTRAVEVARLLSGSPTAAALARAAELIAEGAARSVGGHAVRTMAPS